MLEATMSSPPVNETLRVPPDRATDGPSGALAQALRRNAAELDDVSRARMERSLVQAWRTHAAARVPLPGSRHVTSRFPIARQVRWAASLAASAVAGALIAFFFVAGDQTNAPPAVGTAHFELRIGDAAVQSGSVAEGQVLESGKHGYIELNLGSARVRMEHDTRLRLDRMSAAELSLSLLKGRVDVDFHPLHKGEQRMLIESLAARVQVVGTRFAVLADDLGNTKVAVTEGVVEVVPRSGAPSRRVAAGQNTYVRVDDGDEYERAVREAIERGVAGKEAQAVPVPAIKPDMDFSIGSELEAAPGPLPRSIARRLDAARKLLRQGHHPAARASLRGLTEAPTPMHYRVEALMLTAESYTAQGDIPRAAQSYRRADEVAPTQSAGHNARFALARLLERYTHDKADAANAYRRYLERAPKGALASQAREALCRLGEGCKNHHED
jgi:hypothetical protein